MEFQASIEIYFLVYSLSSFSFVIPPGKRRHFLTVRYGQNKSFDIRIQEDTRQIIFL